MSQTRNQRRSFMPQKLESSPRIGETSAPYRMSYSPATWCRQPWGASRSSTTVCSAIPFLTSNRAWRDVVATWGLDQRSPASTFSSYFNHLENIIIMFNPLDPTTFTFNMRYFPRISQNSLRSRIPLEY